MKQVKLFIEATYTDRQSFNNKVQEIINVPEDFKKEDIVEKIPALKYSEGYKIDTIQILSTIENS